MDINFQQLYYLVQLDLHRNFSKAAEQCHVSQPSLSMQIKKLEGQVGTLLFDRSKKPLVPTEIGERIITQAREILRQVEGLQEIVNDCSDTVEGVLRIGVIPTVAPYLLPQFLGPMANSYPKLRLEVKEMKTEQIIQELKKDQLDVGIAATPLSEIELKETPLYYERFYAYSRNLNSHDSCSINDILEKRLWILEEGNCFRNQTFNLCHLSPRTEEYRSIQYEGGSLETLKRMVDSEGGATLLPELAVQKSEKEKVQMVCSDLGEPFTREIGLLTYRTQIKKRLVKLLQQKILSCLPEGVTTKKEGQLVFPV